MAVRLAYSSNNSGGRWWLKDEHWKALEAAGWTVEWCKDRKGEFCKPDADGRWLGALATSASKDVETPDQGLAEWERLTGLDPWAEGCNCCGQPHSFSYEDAKGETHFASIETRSSFGGWS